MKFTSTTAFTTTLVLASYASALPLWSSLTSPLRRQDSECSDGEFACVDGKVGQCAGGKWSLTECASGQTCVYFTDTNPGCDTPEGAQRMGYSTEKGGSAVPSVDASVSVGGEGGEEEEPTETAEEPSAAEPTSTSSTGEDDGECTDVESRELWECDPAVDEDCVEVDERGFEIPQSFSKRQLVSDTPEESTAAESSSASSSSIASESTIVADPSGTASETFAPQPTASSPASEASGDVTVTVTETVTCTDMPSASGSASGAVPTDITSSIEASSSTLPSSSAIEESPVPSSSAVESASDSAPAPEETFGSIDDTINASI